MNAVVNFKNDQATNGGDTAVLVSHPYFVHLRLQGASDFLFHRWNCDSVEAKAKSAKGSAAKKSDDVESYVYRTEDGDLAIPGEYVRQAIIGAAKFQQDPRSPRKSAADLFKAAVISLTNLSSVGKSAWDYEDRRRVMVQRNGVTRVRPALRAGWEADFELMVQLPEYVDPLFLRRVVDDAGRLIGIGDFRPTFGRFTVSHWEITQ